MNCEKSSNRHGLTLLRLARLEAAYQIRGAEFQQLGEGYVHRTANLLCHRLERRQDLASGARQESRPFRARTGRGVATRRRSHVEEQLKIESVRIERYA